MADTMKVLSLAGLQKYDGLIKTYIGEADAKAIKYAKIENGVIKLYKAEAPAQGATPDFSLTLPTVDLTPYELKSHAGDIPAGATATTITGYAAEVADAAEENAIDASAVAITADNTGLIYTVTQGGTQIAQINIPADMVVSSGRVVTFESGDTLPSGVTVPGTYIELTIANATSDKLYINATDLVDIYTAAASATQVQLAIDANNVISASIVAGSITATELATDAVITVKIQDGAVTTAKLGADAVTNAKLADDAVQTENIVDANVTAAKLAADSVVTAKIADGNVTAAKLDSDSVTTAKIVDANVTKAKLASTVQASLDLADSAVQPEDIVVITDAEIEALFPSA